MVLFGVENITNTEMHAVGKAEASKSEQNLVDGLSDYIVLAEIVPRLSRNLPWNKRPILNLLNRSWAKAMTGNCPLNCDRQYNPDTILSSGAFIVFRGLYGKNDGLRNEDICMWVWNPLLGLKSMLPPPTLYFDSWIKQMLVCDGDCVYVVTGSNKTQERETYNVRMLNLREFNITWKKLPPLPRLGSEVDAINYLGERYICHRSSRFSWEAVGIWKLSASGESNSEWNWQCIDTNTTPLKNLNLDTSDTLPSYIEIIQVYNKNMGRVAIRSLYARLSTRYQNAPNFTVNGFSKYVPRVSCILLIPRGDGSGGSDSRAAIHDDLYYLVGGLDLRKVDFFKEITVEVGEWVAFAEDWHLQLQNHKQRSPRAIKIFRTPHPCKITHTLKLDPENPFGFIMVAHSGPIYAYELIDVKDLR